MAGARTLRVHHNADSQVTCNLMVHHGTEMQDAEFTFYNEVMLKDYKFVRHGSMEDALVLRQNILSSRKFPFE